MVDHAFGHGIGSVYENLEQDRGAASRHSFISTDIPDTERAWREHPGTSFDGDGFVTDQQISQPVEITGVTDGNLLVTASFSLQPGGYSRVGLIRY